jgi:alanine racemase
MDFGIGRYGFIKPTDLYELMKKINSYRNLELVGLGTRFNPTISKDIVLDNKLFEYDEIISQNRKNIMTNLIKEQINKFNQIVNSSLQQNLITRKTHIHAACSIEVINQLEDIYYDFVRIGGLVYDTIYQKFSIKVPVLHVKTIPENFCIGYFCDMGFTEKSLNVAYIKYYGFHKNAIFKFGDITLDILLESDPLGLIIPFNNIISVGDMIEIIIL